MTFAETADRYAPKAEDIVGPFSPWPPRRPRRRARPLAVAVGIAAIGVMVALPLVLAAA